MLLIIDNGYFQISDNPAAFFLIIISRRSSGSMTLANMEVPMFQQLFKITLL